MSAYNTESALARLLRTHYSRGQDEARALLREAFTLPGDLEIIDDRLHVRLDPASAPRRSKALAALCAHGTSHVFGIEHIERGYENLEDSLRCLGVQIGKVPSR